MHTLTENWLPALWRESCEVSLLIALILAAQKLMGTRLTPRWRHALWLLVLARLALPWSIPMRAAASAPVTIPTVSAWMNRLASGTAADEAAASPGAAQSGLADSPSPEARGRRATSWWALGWGLGTLGFLSALLAAQWRLWRQVRDLRPVTDEGLLNLLEDCKESMGVRAPLTMVETDAVGCPSLFGWVRPRLLLPLGLARSFSRAELRFIFLHELAHVRRHDILSGWLAAILQALHWFNPLVWLGFRRMRIDRELACDALALSRGDEGEKRAYGQAMVRLLEGFGRTAWAPNLAGAVENIHDLKERMRMIAQFQATRPAPASAMALCAVLSVVAFTSCKKESPASAQTPGAGAETPAVAAAPVQPDGPPVITSISPAIGSRAVDPATTTEIVVTFDRDMDPGMSVVGRGPTLPESPAGKKPYWKDARTFVFPVKLDDAHLYRFNLNNVADGQSYLNFRATDGTPLPPTAVYFTTKGASPQLMAKLETPVVVSTEPVNGARNVNPALTEVRINFNVPMGGGMSLCGPQSGYPTTPVGKEIHWSDDRKTLILPAKLESGRHYQMYLNSPSYRNFASESGIPLEPVEYSFDTAK